MAYSSVYSKYLENYTLNSSVQKSSYFTKENMNQYLGGTGIIEELEYNVDETITLKYNSSNFPNSTCFIIENNGKVHRGSTFTLFGNVNENIRSKFGNTIIDDETIGKWQLFFADDQYAYLIYSDMKFPINKLSNYDDIKFSNDNVGNNIYSTDANGENGTRDKLFGYLTDTDYWNNIIGNSVGEKLGTDEILSIGSPSLQMWIESYNAKFNTNLGYRIGERNNGYEVTIDKTEDNPTWSNMLAKENMSVLSGYTEGTNMWYPLHETSGNNYWLINPSNEHITWVMNISYDSSINHCRFNNQWKGCRPVVRVPVTCIN